LDNGKLILIERDKFLAESLREKYSQNKKIEVVEGDALRVLPGLINKLTNKPINYKLVGNVPFYLTGYLFRILGELKSRPKLIVLIIQKEVAKRMTAKPPETNLLSASVGFWAEPEIVDYISRKDFRPMPEVDAAIIKLSSRIYPEKAGINAEKYYKFIKILFKQPRKTILNNLLATSDERQEKREEIVKKLIKLCVNPDDRPQNLSIRQIGELLTLY
jgi:16S rRNA (adenine1518-N6/adenine1519-N6)-dimethyltransferase